MPESPTPAPARPPSGVRWVAMVAGLVLAAVLAIQGSDEATPDVDTSTPTVDVRREQDTARRRQPGAARVPSRPAEIPPTAEEPPDAPPPLFADDTTPAELSLGTVSGQVVDVAGEPVPGARVDAHVRYAAAGPLGSSRVTPLRAGPAAGPEALAVRAHGGVADADGRFEIGVTGVPPVAAGDRLVDIVVKAEGFAACETCRLWVPLGGRIDDVTVVLLRSGRLEGRVVDDVGRPVPEVDLLVQPYDELRLSDAADNDMPTSTSRDVSATGAIRSDDRGRFAVGGLPEGAVWVGVRDARWRGLEPERVLVVHPGSTTAAGDVVVAPRD